MALPTTRRRYVAPDPIVGSPEPFERFYAREFPKMVDIAYAQSGSRMAAEDLAQEAMIAAHRSWDEVGNLVEICSADTA